MVWSGGGSWVSFAPWRGPLAGRVDLRVDVSPGKARDIRGRRRRSRRGCRPVKARPTGVRSCLWRWAAWKPGFQECGLRSKNPAMPARSLVGYIGCRVARGLPTRDLAQWELRSYRRRNIAESANCSEWGVEVRNNPVGIARILMIIATLLGPTAALRAQGLLDAMRFEPIAEDLNQPLTITHAGDGSGRLFLVEQGGRILVHDGEGVLETPFLNISSRVSGGSEQGLLGLAFHPNYGQNGFFYVNYTDTSGDTVIARYQVSRADANVAPADSESVLLRQEQPFSNHNAGELQFGPDGYLYFGLGDGGDAGDPGNPLCPPATGCAQNLLVLLGKMLRIDVDSDFPYAIPPSNPFAGQAGRRPEIWAYGLRNPWRFSFDRETGDMFIGDVGQNRMEEIDFQPASSTGGENYAWRLMEGKECFNPPNNCNDDTLTPPILTYDLRDPGGNCSIIGGYRYRGSQYPQWNGVYFYGDYCSGLIRAATQAGSNWTEADTLDTSFDISTFGEDEAGELYVADHGGGVVYRIETDHPAPQLSSLSPPNAPAGSGAFTLSVRGSNFVPGAQVTWNGAARRTTFVDNVVLQAEIPAADIAQQGAAQVVVHNPAPGGGPSAPLDFVIEAGMTLTPRINDGGVVNGASFAAGAVAAGSIVSIFGVDLAAGTEQAAELPLPTTLNGSTLRFNGSLATPQFYQSPGQMNVQVPWELAGQPEATLQAEAAGETSDEIAVSLTSYSPGLFSMTQRGSGQGAIRISGTGLLAATENAVPGAASRAVRRGEFLEVYATGLGPVTNQPATGAAASATDISHTTIMPTATIGGAEATVTFGGLAPGFVGLYQINMDVPQDAPSGGSVEVLVSIGGVVSNAVTIAVE